MRAVAAKCGQIDEVTSRPRKLDRYLRDRPIPSVRGPASSFHIIDRHHFSLALWRSGVPYVFIKVVDDLSDLPAQQFWMTMEKVGRLHPFDEQGNRVHPRRLPHSILDLKADRYRDLAWSVREGRGFRKTDAPFSEFRWAAFFRERIAEHVVRRDYNRAVVMAKALAKTPAAAHLPGYCGKH